MCGLGASSSAASGPPIAAAVAAAAASSGRSVMPDVADSAGLLLPALLLFSDFADFFLCLELPPLVVEVLRPSLRVPLPPLLFLPLLLRVGDEVVLAGADSGAACADACWAAVASSSPPIPDEASGSGFSHPSPRGILNQTDTYAEREIGQGLTSSFTAGGLGLHEFWWECSKKRHEQPPKINNEY